MNLSPDERDSLTRVVLGESSDDPTEQAGVAWNVLNRVGKQDYGDSIHDVIYQKNQYQSIQNTKGPFYRFSPEAYAKARSVVDSVASGETPDPTGGAPNFLAASMPPGQRPKWAQGEGRQIGKTIFYGGHPMMSQDEAQDYLAGLTAKGKTDSSLAMSQDDADVYLKKIIGNQSSPSQQVAGDAPMATSQQAMASPEDYPQGVGLATLFHDLPPSLQQTIRDHPYMAGAIAAGAIPLAALIPEGAAAAAGGLALRHLIWPSVRAAATAAGGGAAFDYFTGGHVLPKLIDMIGRLGEEGQ